MDVDPVTVARWWRIFRDKAGALMMALTEKLAHSPQLSGWVSGNLRTCREKTRKILELIGRCRATFSPDFGFCGFAWVNVLNPYLLFSRKGITGRNPGAAGAG